jgi:hypothetical protein
LKVVRVATSHRDCPLGLVAGSKSENPVLQISRDASSHVRNRARATVDLIVPIEVLKRGTISLAGELLTTVVPMIQP